MALKNAQFYEPTSNFLERLEERYDVPMTDWRKFMVKVYSSLEKNDAKTISEQKANRSCWRSKKLNLEVIVDEKKLRLITIYPLKQITPKPKNSLTNNLGELIVDTGTSVVDLSIDDSPEPLKLMSTYNSEAFSDESMDNLEDFAQHLINEKNNFIARSHYKYSQKVLQESDELFQELFDIYPKVISGAATKVNQDAMTRLKEIKKDLVRVLNALDLPTEYL